VSGEYRQGRTVWVVDDDISMRMLIQEALLDMGFDVRAFASGTQTINAFKALAETVTEDTPDIILADIQMPGVNGFQLCSIIKSMPEYNMLPIIMVTGIDDSESIDRAYACGAMDFIIKPVNWTILKHRLHFVLQASDALQLAKRNTERLERAEKIAALGHLDWDIQAKCIQASDQIFRIFDIEPQSPERFYTTFYQAIHQEDRLQVEMVVNRSVVTGEDINVGCRLSLHDGSERHVQLQGEVHRDHKGMADYIFATLDDTSDHKKYEEMINRLAYYDEITGIPNRSLFKEHLKLALHQAKRTGTQLAVMFLDLDHFKGINDTLGHQAGDMVLKIVAERLSASVRTSDIASRLTGQASTIARLGGDEFTVLLTDLDDAKHASLVVERIQKAMTEAMLIEGQMIHMSFSIGVSAYPADGQSAATLLKHADVAMYYSKKHGRNRHCYYRDISQPEDKQQFQLENDLYSALEGDQLHLYFQPKVILADKHIAGFEALLRWFHPERGLIPPIKFIPMAEKNGLILPIGEWVIREACKQAYRWQQQGFGEVSVAVNVAASQLSDPDLAALIGKIIAEEGVKPAMLHIEVTESMLMQDMDRAINTLSALKQQGIHLSLDDFGTGYSSMSYLKHFPMDSLKIDRSFIIDICQSEKNASIARSMIALARNLGMTVIAEGVETEDQLKLLQAYQCHQVQGYLFAKPMPASEATVFLQQQAQRIELSDVEDNYV